MDSSNMSLLLSLVALLIISAASAADYYVGNDKGWVTEPSQEYNRWAGNLRFRVNDVLVFKYNKEDSVLLVEREDYDNCNSKNPIKKLVGGYSNFRLDRSGPFFFINDKPGSCAKGHKMIVVVLADRNPISQSPLPPPSPPLSLSKPPTSSPPPSPSTKPPTSSPSPSPSPSKPSTSPSPTPSTPPTSSPSPSPSAKAPPTSSPSPLPTPPPANSATPPSPSAEPPTSPPPPPGSKVPPYDVPRCPPVVDDDHTPPAPPKAPTRFLTQSTLPTEEPSPSPLMAPAPAPATSSAPSLGFTSVSHFSLAMLIMFLV